MGIGPSGQSRVRSKRCQRPRVERDVEPVAEVVAAALVDLAGRSVGEPPRASAQVVPRQRDVTRRGPVAEVDDDELARAVAAPAPGDEVVPGVVARPSRCASPSCHVAGAEDGVAQRAEQPLVERARARRRGCSSGRRARKTGRRTRRPSSWPSWTSRAPVWVRVVDRRGARLGRRERRGRPRLVVVLEEAQRACSW